mmetsp:Transcript_26806/g.43071  ORF Transcript_26806/g.43071 Transcript_26806/m.43071 type:complete len:520 (+) Transcript_26806:230-1789(+)
MLRGGATTKAGPTHELMSILRAATPATCFLALSWASLINPKFLLELTDGVVPKLLMFEAANSRKSVGKGVVAAAGLTLASALPESRSKVFELGEIFSDISREDSAEIIEPLLLKAARILGRESIGLAEFMQIKENLAKEPDGMKLVSSSPSSLLLRRARGAFSIVNAMWLLSIIGIATSLGPSVYWMLIPLRKMLLAALRGFQEALEYLINKVLVPMHKFGVFEVLSWAAASFFLVEANRFREKENQSPVAGFIALTGLAVALPSLAYSTSLHLKAGKGLLKTGTDRMLQLLRKVWFLGTTIPLAMSTQNSLLGTGAVLAAFNMIGFNAWAGDCCYALGFESKSGLVRSNIAAHLVLGAMIAAKWLGSERVVAMLEPFRGGVSIFGTLTLFISQLITSSTEYVEWEGEKAASRSNGGGSNVAVRYVARQIAMLASLAAGVFFSSRLDLEALGNTTRTFGVIYLWTKFSEFCRATSIPVAINMLLTSVGLWKASHWFHRKAAQDPGFVKKWFADGFTKSA